MTNITDNCQNSLTAISLSRGLRWWSKFSVSAQIANCKSSRRRIAEKWNSSRRSTGAGKWKSVGFVVGNISCGKVKKENKAFFAGQVSKWTDWQHAKAWPWWFIKSNWQNQDKGKENTTKTNRMTAPEGNLIPEWLSIGTSPKEQKKKTGGLRAGSDSGGKTGCKKWQKGSRQSKKAFEWNKQKKWRRQPSTVGSTVRTTNETSSLRFKLSTWGVLSVSLVYFLDLFAFYFFTFGLMLASYLVP